jgi:hypothetical protein
MTEEFSADAEIFFFPACSCRVGPPGEPGGCW